MVKKYPIPILALFIGLLLSCTPGKESEQKSDVTPQSKRPVAVENGKIFEVNGYKMLYGGADSTAHFNISNSELKDEQYHYGIGREAFPALLEPNFTSVEAADQHWHDTTRFLVAYTGGISKAYSIPDLTRHEVVNDEIDGQPILPAYCILADLGAIYDRQYGDQVLTFALSGYTYYDPGVWGGLDGFILWDRDTESLWWPLIDRSVSGPLKGVALRKFDELKWKETTWDQVKQEFPEAKVLETGQDYERPTEWTKLEDVSGILAEFGKS